MVDRIEDEWCKDKNIKVNEWSDYKKQIKIWVNKTEKTHRMVLRYEIHFENQGK